MSIALADPVEKHGPSWSAVNTLWPRGNAVPAQVANDNVPETSTECICESLIKDIQRLKLERAATRQKLKRARRDAMRVRFQLSRLHKATPPSQKQTDLGRVGETSLAEAVLAAQKKRQNALDARVVTAVLDVQ